MNLSTPTLARSLQPLSCPRCKGPVDVRSRHVAVTGGSVHVYCSDDCLRGIGDVTAEVPAIVQPPRRVKWLIAAGIAVGGTFVVLSQTLDRDDEGVPINYSSLLPARPPPRADSAEVVAAQAAKTKQVEADEALLQDLMQDAWIHPLAGPKRRMPINHTAAFGAQRQNQPPAECLSGHCGVDVGGAVWGEQVHAVHDGVVDWVNRGPNEENGGVFVKIAHRGGSLYSWYFHLAAVPRWIEPGVKVTVGQVIGLLGDTGVKHSGPHLHFAMTVKAAKDRERYIDPEPLIAIWPLWIVEDGKGHMSTAEPPGMPVRTPNRPKPAPASPEPANDNAAVPEAPKAEPAAPATDTN